MDGITKSHLFSRQVDPLRQAECCDFSTSKFLRYQIFSILAAVYVCPWPIHHNIVKMFRKLRPMFLCTWSWRWWNMGRNWVDIISSHAQSWALGWRRLTGELIGVEFNLSPQIALHLGLIVTLKCNAAALTSSKTSRESQNIVKFYPQTNWRKHTVTSVLILLNWCTICTACIGKPTTCKSSWSAV